MLIAVQSKCCAAIVSKLKILGIVVIESNWFLKGQDMIINYKNILILK